MSATSKNAQREEQIQAFWDTARIFEKSVAQEAPRGEFVFYDGPPFATGLPHYGHISVGTIKDVVARYKTMQGYRVPRRWGWDCHGLPIENIVEKEIGSKHKKDIVEGVGVAKFNELCRSKVLEYADEWKRIIPRLGRWADMENPYFTMSKDFMESVWWAFKQLYDKKLVYEDYRSMHICPRCETTLSQGEVADGYKEVKDLSVTVKFKVTDPEKHGLPENTYLLAWTTTPWTLPGNVALAVGPNNRYQKLTLDDGSTVIAIAERAADVLQKHNVMLKGAKPGLDERDDVTVLGAIPGSELVGVEYEPLFDYYAKSEALKNRENGWRVYAADFVTTDTGTGIVHIAPAFGADDMALGKKEKLPFVQHVKMDGTYTPETEVFAGLDLKPRAKDKPEEIREADLTIIRALGEKVFATEKYTHSYPHCWRCDTALLNYATGSWFVAVEQLKPLLLTTAHGVAWSPEHIKEGRFGKWLEGARDWSISRQRFWASVIPVWRCAECKAEEVFGSTEELHKKSGVLVADLHKHVVDEVTYPCGCGGTMKRVPDVLDTWFDSGSMPYGQVHYPFENKERFEKTFPAHFITEAQDQTRAWFYYLHVLSGALFGTHAFNNVIVNGIVLAEDGKKMSKKLKNYPDPLLVADTAGADAMRLYMMSSPVVRAENLNFSEQAVQELSRKVIDRLVNTYTLYALYKDTPHEARSDSPHVLDAWIVALLKKTQREVTEAYEAYQLDRATRPLIDLVDDISTWYVRRSRDRIKGEGEDRVQALSTLAYVLREYARLAAPVMPFIAEWLWQELKTPRDTESVHLARWVDVDAATDAEQDILNIMAEVRTHASLGLEARARAKIIVRQPLASITLRPLAQGRGLTETYIDIIKDEVNVKEVRFDPYAHEVVTLDTTLTPELVREGEVRELLRAVQEKRKEAQLMPHNTITLTVQDSPDMRTRIEVGREQLSRQAGVSEIVYGSLENGQTLSIQKNG